MNCNPTDTDIRTAILNKKAFYKTQKNQSQVDTVEFLKHTTDNFEKNNDGKYAFGDLALKTTVTSKLNKDIKVTPAMEQAAKYGTLVHTVLQSYGNYLLTSLEGKSVDSALSLLDTLIVPNLDVVRKTIRESEMSLDEPSIIKIFQTVKDQFIFAYQQQRIINRRSGASNLPVILLEQIVIDPRNDIGGTIDFLAILSDNSAIIRDYKTVQTKNYMYDESGTFKDGIELIKGEKLEKYKLQISEYGKILRQNYGITGTHSNRIVPIRMYTNEKNISKVSGPDELMKEIVPFIEKTGFKSLDDFIVSVESKITKLEADLVKYPEKRSQIKQNIRNLEAFKTEIVTKRSVNNIVKYATSLVEQKVEDLDLTLLQDLLDELRLLQGLGKATYDLRQYTKEEDKTDEIEIAVARTVSVINDKVEEVKRELLNKRVAHLVDTSTGYQITNDRGEIVPFTPDGFFGRYFYRLSEFDNPYFKTFKNLIDEANQNKRDAVFEISKEVIDTENKVYQKLKSMGKDWSYFISVMINPETENLWSKISKDYYNLAKTAVPNKLPEYWEPQEWFVNYQKNEEALYQKSLEEKYSDPLIVLREMDKWLQFNSLELNQDGTPKYQKAWSKALDNNNLKLKEDNIQYSEQFEAIRKVPEFLEYYNMFEKYNQKFRKILGVEYSKLPNNFLPNIRKNMSERIESLGFVGLKDSIQDYIKDFSIREDDKSDDLTFDERKSIPRFYLNPFTENGKIQKGEKSFQLGRSLLIFAKMAYNYQEMTNIEAQVLALREAIADSEDIIVKSGKIAENNMGNIKSIPSNLNDVFNSFVDMYVYGVHVKPIIGNQDGSWEKILLKTKEYFSLKTLGLSPIAALGSYASAKLQAYVTGKTGIYYNEFQYNESLKQSWKDRKRFLAMSAYFDPMGHRFGNIRLEEKDLGEFQLGDKSQRGWINQYVNSRLLMQPFASGDQHVEEVITYAMAQNYYVDQTGNVKKIKFEEQREQFKDRLISSLFQFDGEAKLNLPEDQVKRVVRQFRNAVQTAQAGIKGTISEEDKAYWQGHIVGQLLMNFKSWMPAVMFERFGKVKYKDAADTLYMGRYTAITQEFGNTKYNSFGTAIETKVFLQKILLPKIGQLIGHLLSLHTIGGKFKPYTIKDDGTVYAMYEKFLAENPQYQGKVSYEEFRDIQQKQLKAVIVELRVLLGFVALIMMAMGDWDDDGEKDYRKYWLTRKAVSVLLKTKQELAFMFNPTDFANLTKNPIPIVGLVIDAQKTLTNTFDELFDLTFDQSIILGDLEIAGKKDKSDKKDLLAYSHTWIPGMQGLVRFLDIFSDETQYSK